MYSAINNTSEIYAIIDVSDASVLSNICCIIFYYCKYYNGCVYKSDSSGV